MGGGDHDKEVDVAELIAKTPQIASNMLRLWMQTHDAVETLSAKLPPTEIALINELQRWAETSEIVHTNMFRIFAWDRVVDAFLKLKWEVSDRCLLPGTTTLQIEGYGSLELSVTKDGCSATRAQGSSDAAASPAKEGSQSGNSEILYCTQLEAMRLLFGPLPPSMCLGLRACSAMGLLAA